MPLSGPGKFDDLLGDDSVRKIVCKPKGCARHFKRDMENSLGFGIGIEAVQVGRDSHGKTPKGSFVECVDSLVAPFIPGAITLAPPACRSAARRSLAQT